MAKKVSKPAKASSKAPAPMKIGAAKKTRTKSEVYTTLAEFAGVSRKQVATIFDGLSQMISADLNKGVVFAVPGMMKVTVTKKPATKGGMRPNPFKPGEMMEVKPKPARNVLKIRPLKSLKAMVS
ncbi:MAG: HU family DNA-binding protein [Planctomycetota bacterium]|nr:HU family DNA-binding protein [Planctomycetota bacterium]